MAAEQPATYEIFMADLSVGRGAARSVVTPYTEEIQVATFLVDAWMMKMLPLELVGEFVKRTNKKLWQEYTGEEDEEESPAAPAPALPVPATPMFGGGGFGTGTYAGGGFGLAAPAAAPVTAAPKPAPAPKVEESKPSPPDEDIEMEVCEEVLEWDQIEFSTQDLQEIRDSILASLKKEPFRRLFFELLPKAERFPYLCVKKGAATHADVMLEMLRRNGAIVF